MPFVIIQPRRIRESLKVPASIGVDLLVLLVVAGVIGALFSFGKEMAAPFKRQVHINLSLWALPMYAAFSLARGFVAYGLSLLFTLAYGSLAAHNRRAERVMIPALDILQSLPVLAFLPGIVLAMTHLFPTRELGLEFAVIVTIFTAQAWNMTFSYYASVKQIPNHLREVVAVHHLSRWQVFRLLELPASMIGLVWNSMMSMAGGWFVLNVSESLPVGKLQFSVPGIGSYMSAANLAGDVKAQVAGLIAMVLVIVAVDQLFWRPIVVWSERFKVEETSQSEKARSWVLTLLKHSALYPRIVQRIHDARQRASSRLAAQAEDDPSANGNGAVAVLDRPRFLTPEVRRLMRPLLIWAGMVLLLAGALCGAWELIGLLRALPFRDPSADGDWARVILGLLASFLRVLVTVALAAAWTLPAGILIGLSPRWAQRLQPIVQVLASFPSNMIFLPITLLLVHRLSIPFNMSCVVLMLLGTQWYILFNVIAGAMAIPNELKEVGTVYDTPRWRRWTRIYIPGVFPHLVTGLITAAGGAWNTTIIAEYVEGRDHNFTAFGVGAMITRALNDDNFPLLASGAVTLALAVVIINRLMWRRLYRLAERRYSLET